MFDQQPIQQAIDILKQQFGDRLNTAESVRMQHGHTTTRIPTEPPDAVIFAESTDEIATIMQVCQTIAVQSLPSAPDHPLKGM